MSDSRIRGGYRAVATNLIKELDNLFSAAVLDIEEIKSVSKVLENYHNKISACDEIIQATLGDQELAGDLEESMKRDILITKYLVKVENSLKNSETLSPNPHANFQSPGGLNLPKLNLPYFDGNLLHWTNFFDVFKNAVYSTNMSRVQKFSYLMGQLKGEALRLLDGFSITDAYYDEALNLLCDTYGQPKRIIQCHLHALFDIKEPKANSQSLSEFQSTFECHIRSLESLNTTINAAGFVVVALLLRKLPANIRENINRTANCTCWSLDEFRKAISNEITLLQSVEPETQNFKFEKSVTKKSCMAKNKPAMESKPVFTMLNINANGKQSNLKQCHFCSQNHATYTCSELKTPQAKNEKALQLNLCVNCLSNKHKVYQCTSTYNCKHCHGRHNSALCLKTPSQSFDNVSSEEKVVAAMASSPSILTSAALPIAQMRVINNDLSYTVRALFDQCSQKTFILRSLSTQLKLKVNGLKTMVVDGWQEQGSSKTYEEVSLHIWTDDGLVKIDAYVVDKLPSRVKMPGLISTKTRLLNLGVRLADPDKSTEIINDISLIVGVDNYYRFVCGHSEYEGIQVISSSLGGMIVGPLSYNNDTADEYQTVDVVTVLKVTADSISTSSASDITKIWELDSIGIFPNEVSNREKSVLRDFERNVKFKDGKYIASLPWKHAHPPLPTNYSMAKGCLYQLVKHLKSQDMLNVYDQIIADQLKRGFIEEVTPSTPILPDAKLHYLPHHGVEKDSQTTPLRIVFNCSAGKPSLNDCLESGPSMINELGEILLRFRLHKYACCSDIEKAYLSVSLVIKDRDVTRFVWLQNPNDLNSPIVTYRFKSVLFGAKPSQFLLNESIKHHLSNHPSDLSHIIARNLYIDNLIGTFYHESDMYDFYANSNQLLSKAGLKLREWVTNSIAVQNRFCENNDGAAIDHSYKVLGMNWDLQTDILGYPERLINENATTKREVVQSAARVFDPLGYILPVIIKSRMFIQTLWKAKITWDECLSEELQNEWKVIASEIQEVLSLKVPRQVIFYDVVTVHAFCDASLKAYGANVYIVANGQSYLVMTKAKISGIKILTIPQMELTAATLLARLVTYICQAYQNELHIVTIYAWTDSQIVLQWLKTSKSLKPYVQNRVDEIHKLIPKAVWKYTPSADNPCDMLSRGTKAKVLLNSSLWLNGPKWLNQPDQWPNWENECDEVAVSVLSIPIPIFVPIFNFNKFHTMKKLLITAALVLRFAWNLKRKIKNEPLQLTTGEGKTLCHNLTGEAMDETELKLIRQIQQECFAEELSSLNTPSSPTNHRVKELGLFLSDGILRCSRRIDYFDLDYNAKYPIFLPAKHPFTHLLIDHLHKTNGHIGTTQLVTLFRQKYWCTQTRQTIKKIVLRCLLCKKLFGPPFRTPMPPPLPEDHVAKARPFAVTGIDYTWALTVKCRRSTIKVYIVLFTCAVTRAVHLELVEDNSRDSFLLALRRFIGRRSLPEKIYSDNSSTFTSAGDYLRGLQNHPSVKNFLQDHRIQGKFIPARAPWFGRFWERMIALTKNSLKRILCNSLVTKQELETILVEVENQLNHRPLTYVDSDLHGVDALTPSDLLYGYKLKVLPSSNELLDPDVSYGERSILTKRQKFIQNLLDHFWRRWTKEYLTSLRSSRISKNKASSVQEGDVVLVHDEGPRSQWKMGLITQTHKGHDGNVQSACIKTAGSNITRPIKLLYPLELHLGKEEIFEEGSPQDAHEDIKDKPERAAATKARKLIASQL